MSNLYNYPILTGNVSIGRGEKGEPGIQGIQGIQGVPGKDGSDATVTIVNDINEGGSDKVASAELVKGLGASLDTIATRVTNIENTGGGSGGSGITFRDVVAGEIFGTSTVPTPTVNVTGVTLNKSTTTINTGSTDTLVATISPINATNKNVNWSSSDNSIATVSNGVITGIANGSCTITCTTVDGSKTATCSVTVQIATVSVTGVSLNKSSTTIVNGQTEQLTATVSPTNATNKAITWSSSNTGVATVNSSGLVTGVGIGSATITVSTADGNKTSTCSVTIASSSIAVTSISLNKSTSILTVPNTEQLTVTFTPSNATNQNVTWTSSDNTKATVSASGLVTSVASGNVTITATSVDGNKTATCTYTISASAGGVVNQTGLLSNYKATSVSGSTLTDLKGTNNITLVGSPVISNGYIVFDSAAKKGTCDTFVGFTNVGDGDFTIQICANFPVSLERGLVTIGGLDLSYKAGDQTVGWENVINSNYASTSFDYNSLGIDEQVPKNIDVVYSLVKSGGNLYIYLDSTEKKNRTLNGTTLKNFNTLTLCNSTSAVATKFKSLAIYNRALTQSEITSNVTVLKG